MAFTCGLVSRKGVRATEDAVVVERVKESGAILLGTTNVPELNLWCETRCNVYGQTSNPYNYTRTTGGSSGGEVRSTIYTFDLHINNESIQYICTSLKHALFNEIDITQC